MEVAMKKQMTFIALLAMGAFLIFWSCGSNSTKDNLTEGDYTSQDYQLAKEDADSTVVEMNIADDEVGGWVIWNPGDVRVDTVSYDSTTGWHVRARAFDNDYLQTSVVDSFRFTNLSGQFQLSRDSTTNTFERRLKKNYILAEGRDSVGTHWVRTFERNATWVGLADTVTTLNGNFSHTWLGQTERRSFSRDVQGNLNNIQFYSADFGTGHRPHPFAGTANASVVMDVVTPNREVHLEGTLTITFRMENGQYCYHARLVRGSNWWEWDRCFPE
jgi:hypothetical protein